MAYEPVRVAFILFLSHCSAPREAGNSLLLLPDNGLHTFSLLSWLVSTRAHHSPHHSPCSFRPSRDPPSRSRTVPVRPQAPTPKTWCSHLYTYLPVDVKRRLPRVT